MLEKKIKELMAANRREEALVLIEDALRESPNDQDLLMWKGEVLYGEGKMTDALNCFNAILRESPDNRKAGNYATMINNILGYYCKDMFNP